MPELTPLLLVDLALAISAVELLLLLLLGRRALLLTLSAGLGLMLALRLGLVGGSSTWMALALLVSGLLHAWDLHRRWSASPPLVPRQLESPP